MLLEIGGSSLSDSANLAKASAKLGKESFKAYKRLSKTGFKKGGKVAVRLTRKQLNKLASKIVFKPVVTILTRLASGLTIAAGGTIASGATAASGIGIPISIITTIGTILYTIWTILSVLDSANDVLRLIAQVHIDDQKIMNKNDNEIGDPEIDKAIESGAILST